MLLKQKVMLVFREVIERASPTRDEQTDVNTKKPASVCMVRFDYICCKCRYATPACCASYEAYIKGFPICFHDLQAKNEATDNKFVTL